MTRASSRSAAFVAARAEARRARARLYLRGALPAGLAIATVGGVGFASLRALHAAGRLADPAPTSAALVALVALLAVTAAWRSWRALPSEAAMLRRADDALGLESRLVTALEVAERTPSDGAGAAVREALLRDADADAARVRAEELVPIRLGFLHVAGVAAIATSVVAASMADVWFQPREPLAPGVASGTRAPATSAQREELAEELEALAAVLEDEADEGVDDPYLRALAEASRDLARSLRSSDARAAAQDVNDRLQQLLGHAERALGSRVASSGSDARAGGGEHSEPEALSMPDRAMDVPLAELRLTASDAAPLAGVEDVRAMRERLEASREARVDPYGGALRPAVTGAAGEVRGAGGIGEAPDDAAGAPAGAAERSTDAPGDAAGAGLHGLTDGEAPGGESFARGEELALPEARGAEGARIRSAGEAGANGQDGAAVVTRAPGEGKDETVLPLEAEEGNGTRQDAGGWRSPLDPDARLLARELFEPRADGER